jgi:class 3 adenylate cyclase
MSQVAYLPIDRYQALLAGIELPTCAEGAVLFADISGFSPLTNKLAKQLGPRLGAEEVTRYLNIMYEVLIAEVHRYGGSVISFSGDAITCWFKGELKTAALYATTAALEMHNALQKIEAITLPSQEKITIALKVAVAAGQIYRYRVGDPGIQYFDVLAGQPLNRMAAGEKLAQKHEVVVSEEICELLAEELEIKAWYSLPNQADRFGVVQSLNRLAQPTSWPIFPESFPLEQVRPWLLPAVNARLEAGLGDFLTELRPCVALFVHFSGLDYEADPEAGHKLDDYISWAQKSVNRYGGSLLQVTIGDKGSYFYAIFGAPIAHQSDAELAVKAGMTLLSPPAKYNWLNEVRIGISRGTMRTGVYGSSTRQTYGVLGDEVNVAARLMEIAGPGQILISNRVYLAVSGLSLDWQELGPIEVKGQPEPIQVFRLNQSNPTLIVKSSQRVNQLPLVGREKESEVLRQSLETLLNRPDITRLRAGSAVLIIEGDAGIGKTRLVEDLKEQAKSRDFTVLSGAGDTIEHSTPYFAWRAIFSQIFSLETVTDKEIARRQVLARLEGRREWLRFAPLLDEVLALDLADNEITAQLRGQLRAEQTYSLLLDLIQSKANENPTLLVIDDAYWLDSASWALTLLTAQRIHPLLLVLVSRPFGELAPPEYIQLRQRSDTRQVLLDTLSFEETFRLVCQQLGVSTLPQVVAQTIQDKAQGNPFFSQELVYALRDGGQIVVENGECCVPPQVGDFSSLTLPDSVQGVITSRIDRLSPSQQLTLKAASVIGRVFAFRTLYEIYPVQLEKANLTENLSLLNKLDITPIEAPPPELAYLFKHIITQEVTYGLLPFAQRRLLHRAVAQWYEHTFGNDLSQFYPLLAYHWGKAEVSAKRLEYLEKAGEQALQRYANQEAVRFFREAIEVYTAGWSAAQLEKPDNPLKLGYLEARLGEAYFALNQSVEGFKHLKRAVELLDRPLPEGTGQILFRAVTELLGGMLSRSIQRRVGDKVNKIIKTLELAPPEIPTSSLVTTIRAYNILIQLSAYNGENVLSNYFIPRRFNLAHRLGSSPEQIRAYADLGVTIGVFFKVYPIAEKLTQLAWETGQRLNALSELQYISAVIGLYYFSKGDLPKALEVYEQGERINVELGDSHRLGGNRNMMALVYYCLGNYKAGEAELARLEPFLTKFENPRLRQWQLNSLAMLAAMQGKTEESWSYLKASEALLTKETEATSKAHLNALMAKAYLQRGEFELARQQATAALDILTDNKAFLTSFLNAYNETTSVFLNLWEAELKANPKGSASNRSYRLKPRFNSSSPSRRSLKRIFKVFRTFVFINSVARPWLNLHQGTFAWLSGQPARATKLWHKSLKRAEKLGIPQVQASAHYQLGRIRPLDDPQRRYHLEQAQTIFSQIDAAYDLKLVKAELNVEPELAGRS